MINGHDALSLQSRCLWCVFLDMVCVAIQFINLFLIFLWYGASRMLKYLPRRIFDMANPSKIGILLEGNDSVNLESSK